MVTESVLWAQKENNLLELLCEFYKNTRWKINVIKEIQSYNEQSNSRNNNREWNKIETLAFKIWAVQIVM